MKEEIKASIHNYITWGYPPGDFLESVLTNDLSGAFGHGDSQNVADLREIIQYLNAACPRAARGTAGQVRAWCRGGGSAGRRRTLLCEAI